MTQCISVITHRGHAHQNFDLRFLEIGRPGDSPLFAWCSSNTFWVPYSVWHMRQSLENIWQPILPVSTPSTTSSTLSLPQHGNNLNWTHWKHSSSKNSHQTCVNRKSVSLPYFCFSHLSRISVHTHTHLHTNLVLTLTPNHAPTKLSCVTRCRALRMYLYIEL